MTTTRRDLFQQCAVAAAGALLTRNAQAQTKDPLWKRLFPAGFRNERVKTSGAEINSVIGGSGPPLLLLHGAPMSLLAWTPITAELAKEHTVVAIDLRGRGDSSKPHGERDHSTYSKRAMALDGVEVMKHYGFTEFGVAGHDRGGRVARRLALDHPAAVRAVAILDVIPEHYIYSHVNEEIVQAYFHFFDQLRPEPGPENDYAKRFAASAGREMTELQAEYERNSSTPEGIHASIEDYRASGSIDLKHDAVDIAAGRKIQCPILAIWAAGGTVDKLFPALEIWKKEGPHVSGKALPGQHDLMATAPKETLAEMLPFFRGAKKA